MIFFIIDVRFEMNVFLTRGIGWTMGSKKESSKRKIINRQVDGRTDRRTEKRPAVDIRGETEAVSWVSRLSERAWVTDAPWGQSWSWCVLTLADDSTEWADGGCVCVCARIYVCVRVCTCVCVCLHVRVSAHVCLCVCLFVSLFVCVTYYSRDIMKKKKIQGVWILSECTVYITPSYGLEVHLHWVFLCGWSTQKVCFCVCDCGSVCLCTLYMWYF